MEYKVIVEFDPDEKCWVTFVPSLDDISTWGRSKEEALSNTREAIEGYLEALKKEGLPLPPSRSVEIAEVVVAT
ncbi:MAG: type II toxin-antitoxin system HicB family antitoxin [Actinomycetota bacterium]|nr:type II toxin-antitoxin system HicB family antitoxin [Actinomycetota bacterium]